MSAVATPMVAGGESLYARLFREGHAEVVTRMRRAFPRRSSDEVEDIVSAALLEIVRGRWLTEWTDGTVGQWYVLSRRRMLDEMRRHGQRQTLAPLNEATAVSSEGSVHDRVEQSLSDWRVVELMAQLSERAATYVRLRMLEGGTRAEVFTSTGWTRRQYERAQSEAKSALRATLTDIESASSCNRIRDLINAVVMDDELPARTRLELRAHSQRCPSCRAYRQEAQRTVHGAAPLVALTLLPVSGGAALAGSAAVGTTVAVPMTLLGKGTAAMCVGALCIGGVMTTVPDKGQRPSNPPSQASTPPPSAAAQAITASHAGSASGASVKLSDPLGLGDLSGGVTAPAKTSRHQRKHEAAFGLGAPRPQKQDTAARDQAQAALTSAPEPAPRNATTSCSPGELGC